MVLQDAWLFKGTIRENIAYGAQGEPRRGARSASRGRGRPRGPLRAHAARRLRHGPRRRRDQRVGGREAAADDRPRVPRRPADPHPRRGDLVGGHAHRGAHPARDEPADGGPDLVRHRAPAVHDPRRGRDPGHERRAGSSSRAPTTSCWPRAASTTSCTRASSRRRSSRSPRTRRVAAGPATRGSLAAAANHALYSPGDCGAGRPCQVLVTGVRRGGIELEPGHVLMG